MVCVCGGTLEGVSMSEWLLGGRGLHEAVVVVVGGASHPPRK